MKIITNLLKDAKDELLVHTTKVGFVSGPGQCLVEVTGLQNAGCYFAQKTATINAVNPIVDRIMDDDSVEGVIMTNKEGAPILTNVSLTSATSYGQPLNKFATMTSASIKELDIFDEVLAVRLVTNKKEIMLAPNNEFNVIVVQHERRKTKQQPDK